MILTIKSYTTEANVIMVAIGSSLMFRLKEILPVNKKVFWDDLKVARRIYQGRALDSVTGKSALVCLHIEPKVPLDCL